jgi:hypothetical protein
MKCLTLLISHAAFCVGCIGLAEAKIVILITGDTVDYDLEAWQNSSYGKNLDTKIYTGVDSIQKAGEILRKGYIKAIQIYISGHGTPEGGTSAKPNNRRDNNFNSLGFGNPENTKAVKDIKSGVAKDATLTHISCHAGKKPSDLQETANILDIKVRGWTGEAYGGPNPKGNPVEKTPNEDDELKKLVNDKLIPPMP